METVANHNQETTPQAAKPKTPVNIGVPYPTETIETIIQVAKQMVAEHGTGRPITKEEIAKAVNKSEKGLSQFYSTFVQYGVFVTVHGKGYSPTELFRKYLNPVHDGDEEKYMLDMFKKPPLYSKIIDNQNGHVIPTDIRRLGNMLKDEPYNVSDYATEKAARIFLENARSLRLLDANNTFRLNGSVSQANHPPKKEKDDTPAPPKPQNPDSNLFELPIPLPNRRKAYLRYPLEDLSKRDIRVIQKALDFIASSIEDDDDHEDLRDTR